MDKSVISNFKEKKDYILIQLVERRWSNNNSNNNDTVSNACSYAAASVSKLTKYTNRMGRGKRSALYRHQRTNSLSAFYNTGLLSYARKTANNETKRSGAACGSSESSGKDVRVLLYDEKIMEAQNKWTGNGQFIIRKKSNFAVSFSL